jgi:predicted Zn-dependent peptidase
MPKRSIHAVVSILCPALFFLAVCFSNTRTAAAAGVQASRKPETATRDLPNGIRAVVVHFPHSTNLSIYTFSPLSLATDAAHQAQWSHLVEHMVIRSTVPEDVRFANAETLPDHMRLDFYGNVRNWQEGLAHHREWLQGIPFIQTNLDKEKPNVNRECDFTARNFATHKFAIAAWNQGYRQGVTQVKLKGDVLRATLPEIQALRDRRLVISNQVTVCVVGGLEPTTVFGEIEKQFSKIPTRPAPDPHTKPKGGNLELTWDMDANHLLLVWPIPGFREADHAPLLVAAQLLNQALSTDSQLPNQTGMMFAGADLIVPEGTFFYVSASLRPGAKFDDTKKLLLDLVRKFASDPTPAMQTPFVAQFLSRQLVEVPSLDEIKSQVPPDTDIAMLEGNLGLRFGMSEHRYGSYRPTLSRQIADVKGTEVQRVAKKYLAPDKASVCTIRPE